MKLRKIIIWGHKLHSHTHSYIHGGFYKAFKHLGYDTYWLDNEDDIENFNFDNSLFLTEGQEFEKIPHIDSCFYILHNVDGKQHQDISINKKISIQVLVNSSKIYKKYNDYEYYLEYPGNGLFLPWATDLLPHEIDENISSLEKVELEDKCSFIGMRVEPWNTLARICEKNDIEFIHYGGTFDKNSERNKSFEENQKMIKTSIIAPSIQYDWQIENGYIPCRIFKNISYGKMGMTNNNHVNELFDNRLVFDTDIEKLVEKGLEFEKREDKFEILKELMIEVRDNHTYLQRIEFMKWYLEKFLNVNLIKCL